ncbi:MAG: aminodeoxychorismate lyase, partial [Actinobacteria bacterium HGW-Actinobacteria-8]
MTDLFEAEATTTTSLDLRRVQRLQRRSTRRKWALVFIAVGLVLTALGGSVAYNFVTTTFASNSSEIADYEGLGQGTVQVVIEPGDTGTDIAATLYGQGVVASEQAFIDAAKANPDSSGIKPGFYFMQREMKAEYALLALLDPNNRDLRKITIPEGKSIDYYFDKIASLTGATLDEVTAAAEDTEALGLPAEADGNLEGWL